MRARARLRDPAGFVEAACRATWTVAPPPAGITLPDPEDAICLAAALAARAVPCDFQRARLRVRGLEDEYLTERFRRMPGAATRSGWPCADHTGVTDVRPEAIAEWQRFEDGLLAPARAVDPRAVAGTPEAATLGILLEAL